jgi:tight adherence protein B
VAAVSGWVVAIVVAPLLALGLPYLLTLPQARDIELLEALDRWVRSLSATLSTGRSVSDSIRLSRRTAPPAIATEVGVLVSRLDNRWNTHEALQKFADDLDSADADPIVAALMLASDRGAVGASTTLGELAESIQDQLRGRRLIETERNKPYVVVRQVTVITMITLVGVFVLSPGFFAAYRTPVGQMVLSVLIVAYIGSLVLLRRRAKQAPRARVLVRSVVPT